MAIQIIQNDITMMKVDAIVNPANNELRAGGGACGAIHDAAGRELEKECLQLGGCADGEAKATRAYNLPCRFVIHTVGPVWAGGKRNEEAILRNCYLNSLSLAKSLKCTTVAFPLISSGIFGYPKDEALRVAYSSIGEFLSQNEMDVYIVLFDKKAVEIGEKLFAKVKQYIDEHYVEKAFEKYERRRETEPECMAVYAPVSEMTGSGIELKIKSMQDEMTFSQMLLSHIASSGLTNAECYNKAFIDRKHFSKIISQKNYQPTKATVYSFALALKLTLCQTEDLLERAGFHFSNSIITDVIVRFAITEKIYDILEVNKILFTYNQKTL